MRVRYFEPFRRIAPNECRIDNTFIPLMEFPMTTSSATVTATDIATKTLDGEDHRARFLDGQLTYTTCPTSIDVPCETCATTPEMPDRRRTASPVKFEFVGYTYDADNVQVTRLGTRYLDKLDLTFQFNGQTISADLIFQITDENRSQVQGRRTSTPRSATIRRPGRVDHDHRAAASSRSTRQTNAVVDRSTRPPSRPP